MDANPTVAVLCRAVALSIVLIRSDQLRAEFGLGKRIQLTLRTRRRKKKQ